MNARNVVKYGNLHLLDAIKDIDEKDWEKVGATPEWSMKDILSHLTSYEHFLVDALHSVGKSESEFGLYLVAMTKEGSQETFNEDQVKARRGKSYKEILDEYTKANEEADGLLSKMSSELLAKTGTIPWYGNDYSLDDFIVYANYGHKESDVSRINAFKDQLKKN